MIKVVGAHSADLFSVATPSLHVQSDQSLVEILPSVRRCARSLRGEGICGVSSAQRFASLRALAFASAMARATALPVAFLLESRYF